MDSHWSPGPVGPGAMNKEISTPFPVNKAIWGAQSPGAGDRGVTTPPFAPLGVLGEDVGGQETRDPPHKPSPLSSLVCRRRRAR